MEGQYDFDAEVELEKQNFLKGLFPKLKTWYVSDEVAILAEKYGPFPSFWQDLGTWEHYNVVKKVYFIVSEKEPGAVFDVMVIDAQACEMLNPNQSSGQSSGPSTVPTLTSTDESAAAEGQSITSTVLENTNVTSCLASSSGSSNDLSSLSSSVRRKRRWDTAGAGAGDGTAAGAPVVAPVDACSTFSAVPVPPAGPPPVLRNRWGPPADAELVALEEKEKEKTQAASKKKGSRFSGVAKAAESETGTGAVNVPPGPPPVILTAEAVQQSLVLQMQAQAIYDRLQQLPQEAARHEQLPPSERPTSPAPIYDSQGRKINTYEVRIREELTTRRMKLIKEMVKLNPYLPTPPDYVKPKPTLRLDIPVEEFPDYNFIGLIIGPRGNTQKRLEQQTGCRISIRGKGAGGSGGRKSTANVLTSTKNVLNDENEALHVHISGDTDEAVEKCGAIIREILIPCEDDSRNEHKQKQLKELALINGTLVLDDFCDICGLRGHRPYECPERNKTFKAANVKCAICGDMSHPTRDCPLKENPPSSEVALDSEYQNFMAELEGRPKPAASTGALGTSSGGSDGSSPGTAAAVGESSAGGGSSATTTSRVIGRSGMTTVLSSNMFEQFLTTTPATRATGGASPPVEAVQQQPTIIVSDKLLSVSPGSGPTGTQTGAPPPPPLPPPLLVRPTPSYPAAEAAAGNIMPAQPQPQQQYGMYAQQHQQQPPAPGGGYGHNYNCNYNYDYGQTQQSQGYGYGYGYDGQYQYQYQHSNSHQPQFQSQTQTQTQFHVDPSAQSSYGYGYPAFPQQPQSQSYGYASGVGYPGTSASPMNPYGVNGAATHTVAGSYPGSYPGSYNSVATAGHSPTLASVPPPPAAGTSGTPSGAQSQSQSQSQPPAN